MLVIKLNQDYSTVEEAVHRVANGILVIHQKGSGSFLMLNNLLVTFLDDIETIGKEEISCFSVNEFLPLYNESKRTFGRSNNSTVIIIRNSRVDEILCSPISKHKLLNSIQTLVTLGKLQNGRR